MKAKMKRPKKSTSPAPAREEKVVVHIIPRERPSGRPSIDDLRKAMDIILTALTRD
jgi:hypothetical protein